VHEFLSRFASIPDMLELDHLTVSGDVTFGRGVTLKVPKTTYVFHYLLAFSTVYNFIYYQNRTWSTYKDMLTFNYFSAAFSLGISIQVLSVLWWEQHEGLSEKQVQMCYGSGTVDRIASGQPADADAAAVCALTFMHEMTSWLPSWKYDIISEIWLSQLMHIYARNNPAKVHPDLILNDRAFMLLL